MPSKGAKVKADSNEIIRRLKAGNGKIAGLKMLAAVDDTALMPVDVIGIDYNVGANSYHSGISIHVVPTNGHGSVWMNPGDLIDNTPAQIDLFQRKAKANDEYRKFQAFKSDRERRSFVLNLREKMTPKQREYFAGRLPDRLGEKAKSDPVAAINKASGEYELREVAVLAAKIVFGVEGEGIEEIDE